MADFSKFVVTDLGRSLIAKVSGTEDDELIFTKVATSDKVYNEEELNSLTNLEQIKQESAISLTTYIPPDSVKVSGVITGVGLSVGYFVQTVAYYAKSKLDNEEKLFAVTINKDTEKADWISPNGSLNQTTMQISGTFIISNAEVTSVTVVPDGTVSVDVFNEHVQNESLGVHGSTVEATPSKLIIRDESGYSKIKSPSYEEAEDEHIMNKKSTIEAIDNKTFNLATKIELEEKQDKLTAGTNITISEDNVISATGQLSQEKVINVYDNTKTYSTGDIVTLEVQIEVPEPYIYYKNGQVYLFDTSPLKKNYKCIEYCFVPINEHTIGPTEGLVPPIGILNSNFVVQKTATKGQIIEQNGIKYKVLNTFNYYVDPVTEGGANIKIGTKYTAGQIFDYQNNKYKVLNEYWWFDNPVVEGGANIKIGTKYTAGQIFDYQNNKYKVLNEYWWFDNPVVEGGANIKIGTKYTAGQIFDYQNNKYKVLNEYWWFDNPVVEGGANVKIGNKVTVGTVWVKEEGEYICIKECWWFDNETEVYTPNASNKYFNFLGGVDLFKSKYDVVSTLNNDGISGTNLKNNVNNLTAGSFGYMEVVYVDGTKIQNVIGSTKSTSTGKGSMYWHNVLDKKILAEKQTTPYGDAFGGVANNGIIYLIEPALSEFKQLLPYIGGKSLYIGARKEV